MQLTLIEAEAIQRFAQRVTVPLFLDSDNSGGLLATGTLFKVGGRSFLITARHIFDDVPDISKLAISENPLRGSLYTLDTFTVSKPVDEQIDVAAVELKSPEIIKLLEANWRFLSLENVARPSRIAGDGAFFVSGFPEALTKNVAGWINGTLITAYTQMLPTAPAEATQPVIPEIDLFFDYSHEATSITGESISTPKLPGVSGASIWEIQPVSGVWAPETAARVVGIQSAYIHSKYIRGKSWLAVAKVLEQVDPCLAEAIRTKLSEL